jgi:hypothetical protein
MKRISLQRGVGAMVCGVAAGCTFTIFLTKPELEPAWLMLACVMVCNAFGLLYGAAEKEV